MWIGNCLLFVYIVSYLVCSNQFCKGTAKRLSDGTIKALTGHSHEANIAENEIGDLLKQFRSTLIQRSVNETTKLKIIYDEESIR